MIKVAPSILAADPLRLEESVRRMADAGCDLLHVDIMDAHFVPNLSFSPAITEAIHRRFPQLKLDVHLMMDNPAEYLRAFAEAGAWSITVHQEIPGGAKPVLEAIRSVGLRTGLSLKPGTPAGAARELLPLCDMVLVMTVEPGFGGQRFQPAMTEKLRALRAMGYTGALQADGGVKLENLPLLRDAGLDVAVIGTALFRAQDPADYIERIHQL